MNKRPEKLSFVIVQFLVSNIDLVPNGIFATDQSFRKRDITFGSGRQILKENYPISLIHLDRCLEEDGFDMVGAFFQRRKNFFGREYFIVRFSFSSKPEKTIRQAEFQKSFGPFMAFRQLVCDYFWEINAYLNPSTKYNQQADFLSINPLAGISAMGKLPTHYLLLEDYNLRIVRRQNLETRQ